MVWWHRPVMAAVLLLVVTSLMQGAIAIDVDGGWTPWSELTSSCDKPCGNGTLEKIRLCDNPRPQGSGGSPCLKSDGTTSEDIEVSTFPCNEQDCWDLNPLWSSWSECGNCSIDPHYRMAECGVNITCTGAQEQIQWKLCDTWRKADCPSPCQPEVCPKYSLCKDYSNETFPIYDCSCTMGYAMENEKCVRPPPPPPTPRPIPTLPPKLKIVATVISKTASTVLIVCVAVTLILFILMRNFEPIRVIHMNMEIALLSAHLLLLFPSSTSEVEVLCRLISILLHFFFIAVFMFMLLEALHMYSLVASVVKNQGMFSRTQNIFIGWGMSSFLVLFSMCFVYDDYGGVYHCWLQMNKSVALAQQVPMYVMIIATFTLIEAAGSAEYKLLDDVNQTQLMSAKFSQRTNLFILPLVYVHWLFGVLAEYQQNLGLYALFSTLNAVLGVLVMLLHCMCNEAVRGKIKAAWNKMRGKKDVQPIKPDKA